MTTDFPAMALGNAFSATFSAKRRFQFKRPIKRFRRMGESNLWIDVAGRAAPRPPRFWTARKIKT